MKKTKWMDQSTGEEGFRISYDWKDLLSHQTCIICGNRSGFNGLFAYDDSGELFCSKECYWEVYYA
jgi:hypothetical protein